MAFITGVLLIDAPASALNNAGDIAGERFDNRVEVKFIATPAGRYPYVSAQAFRYWLRTTAQARVAGWKASPILREKKIAYTTCDPITWWDDDLLGYMRAAPKLTKKEKEKSTETTEEKDPLTRLSAFRISTLVSLIPTSLVEDWGVMARQEEGYPIPYVHQFYRTTLQGLFSLDLHACGTFSYRNKAGYRNLDAKGRERAEQQGLIHLEGEKAFRLPLEERVRRVQGLFEAMARLEGGAKQGLHYTDVAPAFCIFAVTAGGNHLFAHIVDTDKDGFPVIKHDALAEALAIQQEEMLSDVYIGWVRGYRDSERTRFEERFIKGGSGRAVHLDHPRKICQKLIADLAHSGHASWLA